MLKLLPILRFKEPNTDSTPDPSPITKAYIIHYKKLISRKVYLQNILPKFKISPVFIESYDRDTINPEEIAKIHDCSETTWRQRTENLYNQPLPFRKISSAEICNSLSHLKALHQIASTPEHIGMVLEDDVIPCRRFQRILINRIKNTNEDFDILFLGSSFSIKDMNDIPNPIPIKISRQTKVFRRLPPMARCADGYVIKRAFAIKLLAEIKQIALPFDFELNYFFKILDPKVYWCEPGIIKQGSQTGAYKSSLR